MGVQPASIKNHDAVRGGVHDSRDAELPQHPGHHLADRPGRVGELLLRYAGYQAATRMLLDGSKIEKVSGHALSHRAERVDRRLLQGLIQPAVQLFGDGPPDPLIPPRRRVSVRELIRNRLDGSTAWTPTLADPPTITAIPSTSPGRAYRTVTWRPSTDARYTRTRPCTTSTTCGLEPGRYTVVPAG